MSNTDDSDNTTGADNGSDTAAGPRPRLPRRAWALLAVAAVAVASVAGAAVWAFNSQDSATAADDQWLSKMADLAAEFPPGFQPTRAGVTQVTEQSLQKQRDLMDGATVIPADCATPVGNNGGTPAPVGARIDSLTGKTEDRLLEVSALVALQPTPVQDVPPHCNAVMFYKAGLMHGFTSPVELPNVPDGVAVKSSQAVRVSSTITDDTGRDTDTVQYVYSALLDDLHTVTVAYTGQVNPGAPRDIDPAPAHHLFTQALAALGTA